jgi:aryl-alcohol dehydrogenase-like predicted oxidoreductase
MNYRKLGRTDLVVSEIALGCSGFWGNRRFPEQQAVAVVLEAFDNGVNFFDTGHNYCNYNAEPRLGVAVKSILSRTDRSKIVISTKAGTTKPSTLRLPFTKPNNTNFSPDYIEETCVRSIANLHCGYLDIFQLHGIPMEAITEPLLERLSRMRQAGMFRYLGVNTHREAVMRHVAKHPSVFDMVLIDLNILQLDRLPVVQTLSDAGVGVVAGTVLAQGHLIKGKIGRFGNAADLWYLARALLKSDGLKLAKAAHTARSVLGSIEEMTPAQAAMAYVLDDPAVVSCVFGTTNVANLHEVMGASGKQLTSASKQAIRDAFDSQTIRLSA